MFHMTQDTTPYEWIMSALATAFFIVIIALAVLVIVGWALGFNDMYDSDDMDDARRRDNDRRDDE